MDGFVWSTEEVVTWTMYDVSDSGRVCGVEVVFGGHIRQPDGGEGQLRVHPAANRNQRIPKGSVVDGTLLPFPLHP